MTTTTTTANTQNTYAKHCAERLAYGWRPLDWLTWASWHYHLPICTLASDPCDDWSAALGAGA